jgi:drug/metabolite transporter (DMT)-like permease
MINQRVKSHLALLVTNIIYGLNYVIAKGIMPDYMMPRAIIFLRVSVTVLIFWILHFIFPSEKVEKRDFFKLAICAVFGVAFNQILFFEGLNLSTPINASIIITVIPVVILIFSHVFLKEKVTGIKVFGIILGAAGALMVILSSGKGEFGSNTMLGDFMIFINSVSWALYLVLIKPLMEKYNSITIMKWIFTFGLIIIFPFTFNSFSGTTLSSIPFHIWMSVSFVVFAATIIAYFLNNYSLKTVSASVNGIYIYLQPLVASVVAILFGKDQLTVIKTIAAILIMTGVFFVTRRNHRTKPIFP